MAYRIRLVLSICICIHMYVRATSLYLISSVGIFFLCLHSMTSLIQGHSLTFHIYTWSKPQLYSFLDNTVFSPNSCLSYIKSYTCSCVRSTASCNMTSPEPAEELFPALQPLMWDMAQSSVCMSCAMMQSKQWYNSVYYMFMN